MSAAISLARGRLGYTAPNPSVGCVLVKGNRVVASAATADGGRPHAERAALDIAGPAARGSTAYVTLEPCAHYGQTPPCADALVEEGVARAVIACRDHDPRVSGQGIEILKSAGIEVREGVLGPAAEALYAGFFHRLRTGKPLVHVDPRNLGYDAELTADTLSELQAQIDALGEQGAARVRIDPSHPLATALFASEADVKR